MRTMTLTVLSTDGSTLPVPVTVTVPKFGRCEDLVQAVSTSCSLREDEMLLVAEVTIFSRIWVINYVVYCLHIYGQVTSWSVEVNRFLSIKLKCALA